MSKDLPARYYQKKKKKQRKASKKLVKGIKIFLRRKKQKWKNKTATQIKTD